jgi:hypothetical protein
MSGMVYAHLMFPWKLQGKRQLKRDVDGIKILKLILKGHDVRILTAFKRLKMQPNGVLF